MKTTKITSMLLTLVTVILLSACAKDGKTGPQGPVGATGSQGEPGPDAKIYDFSIAVGTTTTYGTFNLATTVYDGNDAVLVYWKDANGWFIQIPYVWRPSSTVIGVKMYPEIASSSLFVNTVREDGSAVSPWASSATLYYRAIVIKASAKKELEEKHVDISDYQQVITALSL